MHIQIAVGNLGGLHNLAYKQRVFGHVLVCACSINREYLEMHPDTPPLAQANIRYSLRYEANGEEVATIPELLARREGDCDDLVCYRVAELRFQGFQANPVFIWRLSPDGQSWKAHIVVEGPDGIEDPSRQCGL